MEESNVSISSDEEDTTQEYKKKRNWCWTLWSGPDFHKFRVPTIEEASHLRYAIWQGEKGRRSGKYHYQGYAEFSAPVSMKYVKDLFCANSLHLKPRFASAEAARNYCKKDDTHVAGDGPWEVGTFENTQGKRSDLLDLSAAILEGRSIRSIAMEYPVAWIRHSRGARDLRMVTRPRGRRTSLEIHVIWGPTGSGKTHSVWDKEPDLYPKPYGWWDYYDGEEAVLIDDFHDSDTGVCDIPYLQMLKVTDIYPRLEKVKGGFTYLNFKRLYLTANSHPSTWYKDSKNAFARRITSITYLTNDVLPDHSIVQNDSQSADGIADPGRPY